MQCFIGSLASPSANFIRSVKLPTGSLVFLSTSSLSIRGEILIFQRITTELIHSNLLTPMLLQNFVINHVCNTLTSSLLSFSATGFECGEMFSSIYIQKTYYNSHTNKLNLAEEIETSQAVYYLNLHILPSLQKSLPPPP